MPKVGGRRRKNRTHKTEELQDDDLIGKTPKCFIIKRGDVPVALKKLVTDFREVMYPYTTLKLQESDKTKIKDYIKAAGFYQMSHLVIFTSTKKSTFFLSFQNCKDSYVRFIKNPTGPTMTFKIVNYSNHNEVLHAQRRFKSFSRMFVAPLLVMNGFNDSDNAHIKLAGTMIQSMFPPINVLKTEAKYQKRVVLFNYDAEHDSIQLRQYQISFNLKGIDKRVKKVMKSVNPPNLGKYNSFSDFLTGNHTMFASDSEVSDIEGAEWEQEEEKRGTKKQMSLRLHEVGPRMTLRLYKIEEAVLTGSVVYNRIVKKSKTEIEKQRKLVMKKRREKMQRKQDQEEHVEQIKKKVKV